MKKDARTKQFNMRLNGAETAQIERLANHYGLSTASLFRFLLKAEARRLGLK